MFHLPPYVRLVLALLVAVFFLCFLPYFLTSLISYFIPFSFTKIKRLFSNNTDYAHQTHVVKSPIYTTHSQNSYPPTNPIPPHHLLLDASHDRASCGVKVTPSAGYFRIWLRHPINWDWNDLTPRLRIMATVGKCQQIVRKIKHFYFVCLFLSPCSAYHNSNAMFRNLSKQLGMTSWLAIHHQKELKK